MVRHLGHVDYLPAWQRMQAFTAAREAHTPDELWVLEHPAVYTVGPAGRPEHLPSDPPATAGSGIPVVRTDRGGQVTYHGPGQVIVYTLVDLARRHLKVRDMVCLLEQAAIDLLAGQGLQAERKPGAPGVYIAGSGAKIAALGLKVKAKGCYHGISLNVDMDLAPFGAIDPCGYPGLAVTSLRNCGVEVACQDVGRALAEHIRQRLG